MRKTEAERFWDKVDKHGPIWNGSQCWEWIGARDRYGYGKFFADGKNNIAHRWAYKMLVGPIPQDLQIDHLCRVRHCVNPEHLEVVTCKENIRRGLTGLTKGALKTHCKRGHSFTGRNLIINKPNGRRRCRECRRIHDHTRYYKARTM